MLNPTTINFSVTKCDCFMVLLCSTLDFSFDLQAYHKDLLDHMPPPVAHVIRHPPPLHRDSSAGRNPSKNSRRGRDRRSGSRQHRKAAAGNREKQTFL